ARPEGGYLRLNTEMITPSDSYRFLDRSVDPGTTYYYRLEAIDRTGGREFFGPVSARLASADLQAVLGQSFPNPFSNETTTIPFTLAKAGNVRVRILDLPGREVRLLASRGMGPGPQSIQWDGRNREGLAVSPGVYLYRLEMAGYESTRRLVKLP